MKQQREPLRCPGCGRSTLLVETAVIVVPLQVRPTQIGHIWGDPDPLLLADADRAFCNSSSCEWTGTVADLAEHGGRSPA